MGYLMYYNNIQEIWDELRYLCLDFYGVIYEKMGELGFIQWFCCDILDVDQGIFYLFKEKFDISNGLVQFFICDWVVLIDKFIDEYLMVLLMVCEVGYYFCCLMIGNCVVLVVLVDEFGYV